MLYLPSLASISRQDIAGNSGMEPKGTEKLRVSLISNFVAVVRSMSSQKSLSIFVIASLSSS